MLVSPPSSTRRHRPSVLSVVVAVLALGGCVGVVGEAPGEQAQQTSHDAGRAKRDAKVVGETPSESNGGTTDDGSGETAHTVDPAKAAPVTTPKGVIDAGGPADAAACADGTLATGLRINEIALYQTTKISLYKGGAWVTSRPAPVVQLKKAMVRVFTSALPTYKPRTLRGVLTLTDGTTSMQLTDERMPMGDSTDDQLGSTFTFQVAGALLKDTTQFSVAIQELTCASASASPSTGDAGALDTRFPASGTRSLETTKVGNLKVVVLPVSLSGRVPVTTDAELANMKAALLAYYPVPDVDISVRAPLVWTYPVDAQDGSSWSNLLNGISAERRKDGVDSSVYYFGLMQPAATFKAYCARGCILGLAPQTTSVQPSAQIGLGASFADAQTYETMVHELGHAHGRGHSPCVEGGQIDGVDPKYPDPTGATITWGWDSRINKLMPPTDKDIMGYCQPNWISQYNYGAIATRSQTVNLKALIVGQKNAVQWQHVILYGDGTARWGGSIETEQPGGTVEQADVLDAQGSVIAQTEIVRVPLSHSGDQFGYIPKPEAGWAALKLSDRVLMLSQILPAL